MQELDLSSDRLVSRLLALSESEPVCILDSCGVSHLGSHLLIAGVRPVETIEISNDDPTKTLSYFDSYLARNKACIFTVSYDLGLRLEGIPKRKNAIDTPSEPDLFLAVFDGLIVHDYDTGKTFITGDAGSVERLLTDSPESVAREHIALEVNSNFSRNEYLTVIGEIKELIRSGDTYQTNLTQRLEVRLHDQQKPQQIFHRLRKNHPAPFAAFIQRKDSTVISASPERFVSVTGETIETSPIKGTRPRGASSREDEALRNELLASEKDRAENTMIVDLLRNDLGRICEYGSVRVGKLCELEEHPTLFHLVSTVSGKLTNHVRPSDLLKAIFPCGSITGAPKHRTMHIIDQIETADRGLSMGAIGINIPNSGPWTLDTGLQMSVAIRTMVIRKNLASFNVGGGIVIDSDPEKEYEESLLKAQALLDALGFGNSTKAFGV